MAKAAAAHSSTIDLVDIESHRKPNQEDKKQDGRVASDDDASDAQVFG